MSSLQLRKKDGETNAGISGFAGGAPIFSKLAVSFRDNNPIDFMVYLVKRINPGPSRGPSLHS